LALDFSIAINVFWKNLKHQLYDKNDPYGNQDLIPANRIIMIMLNRQSFGHIMACTDALLVILTYFLSRIVLTTLCVKDLLKF
jgi:hypothetical protein